MAFNITQIVNKFLPVRIQGSDIVMPVDLQFSNIKATKEIVFMYKGAEIGGIWAATSQLWSEFRIEALVVDNTHDQPITLTFYMQDIGPFHEADGSEVILTIPANTINVLIQPDDFPFLKTVIVDPIAINLNSVIAPTTGFVSMFMYKTPII
ncbi:hypothetical protein AWH48_11955 [Domibacillus aminovorans]|uniref:Uncharacterized protein n=1 Tax=Domibacillus aminovorans TaxID=29332 RepID=A0A177KJB2_9BACI|nr:hypothetical protein [Domibacillus aminovorans]OAH53066.1 hypothetical protein AWH48_11955 [Domibacillus aminovorans]